MLPATEGTGMPAPSLVCWPFPCWGREGASVIQPGEGVQPQEQVWECIVSFLVAVNKRTDNSKSRGKGFAQFPYLASQGLK